MERKIKLSSNERAQWLFGPCDENLKLIQKEFKVKLVARGEYLKITGPLSAVRAAEAFLNHLLERPEAGSLSRSEVYLLSRNFKGEGFSPAPNGDERGSRQPRLAVAPKTPGQRAYYDAIRAHDIVFGIGPAGHRQDIPGGRLCGRGA